MSGTQTVPESSSVQERTVLLIPISSKESLYMIPGTISERYEFPVPNPARSPVIDVLNINLPVLSSTKPSRMVVVMISNVHVYSNYPANR